MATTTDTIGYVQTADSTTTNWGQVKTTAGEYWQSGKITLGEPITYETDTIILRTPCIFDDILLARVEKKLSVYAFGKVNMNRQVYQSHLYTSGTDSTSNYTLQDTDQSGSSSYGVILDMGSHDHALAVRNYTGAVELVQNNV